MNEATQNLARRVMASPAFRWLHGTGYENEDGSKGRFTEWSCGAPVPNELALIDLHDPATQGCLHALACEALACEMFSLHLHPAGLTVAHPLREEGLCSDDDITLYREIKGVSLYTQAICHAIIAAGEKEKANG